MLNGQKVNAFPLGSDETKMSLFTTSTQHFTGDSRATQQEKEMRHPDWKRRST